MTTPLIDAEGLLARKTAARLAFDEAVEWTFKVLAEFEAAAKVVGTNGIGLNAKIYGGRNAVVADNVVSTTNDHRGEIEWGTFVPILVLSKHDDATHNKLWGAAMGANGQPYFDGKLSDWPTIANFIVSASGPRRELITKIIEGALLDDPWSVRGVLNAT